MKKRISDVKRAKTFLVILIIVILIEGFNITPSVGKNYGDFNDQSELEIYGSLETDIDVSQNDQQPREIVNNNYSKTNEWPETHQNSVMGVSVTTNKYTYRTGELVEITLDGDWSAIYYEIGSVGYMIYDLSGNFIVEQIHKTIICPVGDPIEWWYGPEVHYWNQTYKIYDEHTQNIYLDKWPHLISPSGKQVPSGKYNVFASINGRVISEPAEFEIISTNQPPVADAGPDQIAYFRNFPFGVIQFVFFNGSNSYDPDGIIVDYFWDFGDGTIGNGVTTTHSYNSLGSHTVTLTVTDNDGATDADTAFVKVIEASAGNIITDKYTYTIGEPINITYSGPHGPPTSYTPPGPEEFHFIIKNENNETIVEEPIFWEICLTVCIQWYGTVSWSWNQSYRIYGENKTPIDLIPPSGEQVPTGKYHVWFDTHYVWELLGPAEFEIINSSDNSTEPLKVTTDKYTYYQGEPVYITITGDRVGPSSDFYRGYLIMDEFGHWVRDPPHLHTTDVCHSSGPDNYTWYQKYEILNEYDIFGNYQIHYPNNGEQVSTGKYYIYPYPGNCEPAEIEIIKRPELIIEKEKISGPDEILTHTYHEWELKITVSNASPTKSYENVVVYDVLPAELELLEFELSQGTLTVIKKGKGKMGSTHLTWHVGDLYNEAELILKIATRKNPAGKQEFTSPGKYLLNEGASAKGTDSSTGKTLKVGPTEPIYITVLENQNHNNKKPHH